MESRYRLQKLLVMKWVCYSLVLLAAAALQTTPGLLTIGAGKPVFILPVCMAVACLEGPYLGGWFALVGGLIWDWTAGRVPGLLALGMVVICFFAAVAVMLILRVNHMNFVMLALVGAWLVVSMDFLFNYWMRNYAQPGVEYISRVIPTVIFTAALSPFAMMLLTRIHRRFTPED